MKDVHNLDALAAELQRLHQRQDELHQENERLREQVALLRKALPVAHVERTVDRPAGATTPSCRT